MQVYLRSPIKARYFGDPGRRTCRGPRRTTRPVARTRTVAVLRAGARWHVCKRCKTPVHAMQTKAWLCCESVYSCIHLHGIKVRRVAPSHHALAYACSQSRPGSCSWLMSFSARNIAQQERIKDCEHETQPSSPPAHTRPRSVARVGCL